MYQDQNEEQFFNFIWGLVLFAVLFGVMYKIYGKNDNTLLTSQKNQVQAVKDFDTDILILTKQVNETSIKYKKLFENNETDSYRDTIVEDNNIKLTDINDINKTIKKIKLNIIDFKNINIKKQKSIESLSKKYNIVKLQIKKVKKEVTNILAALKRSTESIMYYNEVMNEILNNITAYKKEQELLSTELKQLSKEYKRPEIIKNLNPMLKKVNSLILKSKVLQAAIKNGMTENAFKKESSNLLAENQKYYTYLMNIKERFSELKIHRITTLSDIKVNNRVIVSRVSWWFDEDYPTEHEYTMEETLITNKHYSEIVQTILVKNKKLATGYYKKLRPLNGYSIDLINSVIPNPTEKWIKGDSDSEYEIVDIRKIYLHKYEIRENGNVKKNDWIPVSKKVYLDMINKIGKKVKEKQKGQYLEETIDL